MIADVTEERSLPVDFAYSGTFSEDIGCHPKSHHSRFIALMLKSRYAGSNEPPGSNFSIQYLNNRAYGINLQKRTEI